MIHFFFFYAPFYIVTRFHAAHPRAEREESEIEKTIAWFSIWPFTIELVVAAWIGISIYEYFFDQNRNGG